MLDRIYEETEGNAFFLSEVVNLMAQEGTLTKDSVSDIAIPDGVREALGRRLLAERGVKADTSMLSRFLRRAGITLKKRRWWRASRIART